MKGLNEINSVWIYGNGGFAQEVKAFLQNHEIEVVGHITRSGFETRDTLGDSFLHESNNLPVVIGVFNHKDDLVEILDFLEGLNFTNIITPAAMMNMFRGENFSKYYLDTNVDLSKITDYRSELIKKLYDEESISVLDGFINYRVTGDPKQLVRSGSAADQYLGKTLPSPFSTDWLGGPLKWFDIGSFDGDTLRAINESGRDLSADEFLCIEPDIFNFQKLQSAADRLDTTITLRNVAIGSESGEISFAHEGTLSAKQTEIGSTSEITSSVKVLTIDEICESFRPSHIKMDIEGSELSAILGGLQTLKTVRPRIAVSLYHKPMDIPELCTILMENLEDYSWFIRCYGAHGYDTILYGAPNSGS
jgi:FkbM family methyltransferase